MGSPVTQPVVRAKGSKGEPGRVCIGIRTEKRVKRELMRIAKTLRPKRTASALGNEILTAFVNGRYLGLDGKERIVGAEER